MIIFAIPISCQVYTRGLKLEVCDRHDRLVFRSDAAESFNSFTGRRGGTSAGHGSICWVYIYRDVCCCTGEDHFGLHILFDNFVDMSLHGHIFYQDNEANSIV